MQHAETLLASGRSQFNGSRKFAQFSNLETQKKSDSLQFVLSLKK